MFYFQLEDDLFLFLVVTKSHLMIRLKTLSFQTAIVGSNHLKQND